MADPFDATSIAEIAARGAVLDAMAALPLDSQQRVLAKVREQYFKPSGPLTVTVTPTDGSTRFPHVRTSDPGEIRRVIDEVNLKLTPQEKQTIRAQLDAQLAKYAKDSAHQRECKEQLDRIRAASDAYVAFVDGPLALERPQASLHHRWTEALNSGANKRMVIDQSGLEAFEKYSPWNTTSFVIEHDWAAAFAGATDFDGGETRLPYDCTMFEFRISGTPVLVMAKEEAMLGFFRFDDFWVGGLLDAGPGDPGRRLEDLVRSQIRAVCIALDAEVATKETVRAPEKLNRARAKRGQPPLKDYHIVRLHRRARAEPLPQDPNAEPSHHKRMHFVRGHWRHYETHKTWIKWHLRGDPDLGFIEKHYRL